jgi:homoserine kinase type II
VAVDEGWLNVKWKMETDQGPIFVKYYHPERYKLHKRLNRKRAIEKTLKLQFGLNKAGIPCPRPYNDNTHFLQETRSGLFYTVQNWVDGPEDHIYKEEIKALSIHKVERAFVFSLRENPT